MLDVHRRKEFIVIDSEHSLYRIFHKDTLSSVIDLTWDLSRRGLRGPTLVKCDVEDVLLPKEFRECIIRSYNERRPEDGQWVQRVMVVSSF
jgi:hypothetical protein